MRYLNTVLLVLFLGVSGGTLAHEGHDHDELPVSQVEAARVADKALLALVRNKEVDAAWLVKHRQGTQPYKVGQANIWMTTYKKPTTDGKGEDKLYVFIDTFGNYLEANQTGKL